jgi:hypothetical protein
MEKHSNPTGWIILIIIILLVLGIVAYIFSNSEAKKSVCGTHTETYTIGTKGCDGISNCRCLHQSWAGLGACDSCECTKEVSNC